MSIRKYFASKDNTITNAFKENLVTRATDANMGASDSLEVFTIYGQATTSSLEKSRILIEFPINSIIADRNINKLPASGSVNYFLKLFNVQHPYSLPKDYSLAVYPISKSWDEGYGLDMESYLDLGYVSGSGGYGSNWLYAKSGSAWSNEGGDYLSGSGNEFTSSFITGIENLEIDITSLVERWIDGSLTNNGLIIMLSGAYETGATETSFYTKKFSARGSEYFYNKPCIEAKWNPIQTDDRTNFFASSSMLAADDNKMNLYFYNRINGSLKNIAGNPIPTVKFYTNSSYSNEITAAFSSISNPASGTYKIQAAIDTTASVLYDKWTNPSDSTKVFFSGSFDVYQRTNLDYDNNSEYILNIKNLKSLYNQNENVKFNIFIRNYDWQPTIYTVAYNNVENTILPNLYYKIFRVNDNYTIVDYSTGSLAYSKTSYDSNGNYFDLDMNILEKNYTYGIKFATYDGIILKEDKNIFKFRVE